MNYELYADYCAVFSFSLSIPYGEGMVPVPLTTIQSSCLLKCVGCLGLVESGQRMALEASEARGEGAQ
jgi:hypothetical protein